MRKIRNYTVFAVVIGIALLAVYNYNHSLINIDNEEKEYLAFIPNVGDGNISVINVDSKRVIDNIKIGDEVSHGIATTPDGLKLYAGDLDEGKLFVYEAQNKKLVKTILTDKRIHGIDITPNGRYVLLASGDTDIDEKFNYIQIIDTNTDEIIRTIKSDSKSPAHIDFTRDSKTAFVSNVMSNDVSIIDLEKGKIIDKINVGVMPNETELSVDEKYLYVANVRDGSISIVDIDKRLEVDQIEVNPGTHGLAVTDDGKYIWSTNRFAKTITVIDLESKEIIKTIDVDGEPNHVSVLSAKNLAFVSNIKTNKVLVIDINTFDIIEEISVGIEPHEIDFVGL